MYQKTIDKFKRVQARMIKDSGLTLARAVKDEKMGLATYYLVKKEITKSLGEVPKLRKNKKTTFIDIPLKTQSTNVAVVVCQPSQLKDILRGLE